MATRGRPAKVLSSKDLLELEKFLIDLDFLKKNQQKAIQLLQKEYEALDEKDLNLLKIVHREKNQYQQRQTLLDQIKTKQKNQQKLLANEIEILQLIFQSYLSATVVRRQSCMMKHHIIMKHLINQECFTDTATTIHSHKLSSTTFVVTLQFCYFLFSTYYFTHNHTQLVRCKYTTYFGNSERK